MDNINKILDDYSIEVNMKAGRSCYVTKQDAKADIKYYEKEIKFHEDSIKKKKKLLKDILKMLNFRGSGPFIGELVLTISASKKTIKNLGANLERANAALETFK